MSELVKQRVKHIVLQPAILCNLNCAYCYLPDRNKPNIMSLGVAGAVANSLNEFPHPVTLVWHGGEPLTCGIEIFGKLLAPFEKMRLRGKVHHSIQTNATLINDEWCVLLKDQEFRIGVSIDGLPQHNSKRVTWNNSPSFEKTMAGIEKLKQYNIEFNVIAVIHGDNINDAAQLYDFFVSLGCRSLNINIEEQEGLNRNAKVVAGEKVKKFWKDLFVAWCKNPAIRIREFDRFLRTIMLKNKTANYLQPNFHSELWPTISYAGDVVILSPEFISVNETEKQQFIVGNILTVPLTTLLHKSLGYWYMMEYKKGVSHCQQTCPYFDYCGGGHASNKYFELGDIAGTETLNCINTKKTLVDAIIEIFTESGDSLSGEQ